MEHILAKSASASQWERGVLRMLRVFGELAAVVRRIAEQSLLAAGGCRLYVGQSGSALINERRQVLGINSPALGRQAI